MFPKVIHPVKLQLFRRLETPVGVLGVVGDVVFAEPVKLRGQVKYNRFEALTTVPDGNDPVNDGHIVCYLDEWHNSGGVVGDEIELEDSSRLIVIEIRPAVHYRGKYYHVHVYFSRKRTQ